MAIKGSAPAYSLYGAPATAGQKPVDAADGSRLAAASGPYLGRNRCVANNDTCNGPKAKGTEYCVGHLRSMAKESDK